MPETEQTAALSPEPQATDAAIALPFGDVVDRWKEETEYFSGFSLANLLGDYEARRRSHGNASETWIALSLREGKAFRFDIVKDAGIWRLARGGVSALPLTERLLSARNKESV